MLDQEKLLQLLNEPGYKSGTMLGEALGVSRVAVQKRIQSLIENGLPVSAVPSKGYLLEDGVVLLNEQTIVDNIDSRWLESVEVVQSITSTNSHLLSQSISARRARVCLAESQSAGRGRRGNDWQSAPYRNLMLSLSWGFDHWPETITGLGLAVALTITERLNRDYDAGVLIKWPNDLLIRRNKLAGILIDVAGESTGACHVVIGIGLNVHQPDWSQSGDYRWTDLASQDIQCDRNRLASDLVNDLMAMLTQFEDAGFSPMVDRWNALSSYAGERIKVGDQSHSIVGKMKGVDSSGALLLKDDHDHVHRFSDSTVSVRPVE